MKSLSLSVLAERLAICQLDRDAAVPQWVFEAPFWSITRTKGELSIVLPEALVPSLWKSEQGWRCIQVLGPLDFSLTGVLASLCAPLAQAGISMFAISTYDTDYLLVRNIDLEKALKVLAEHGHHVSTDLQAP